MATGSAKGEKIGVLMGGLSAEREVSLKSGTAVLNALLERGYSAVAVDVGRDLPEVLGREGIQRAFVALHGRYGEDGAVQGVLELMGIPYTGSGVLASSLAMNKIFAKRIFAAAGLLVAPYAVVRRGEDVCLSRCGFALPVVVKPSQEGSSVGITIVRSEADLPAALETAFAYDAEVLVEAFVVGQEVQVGIVDDQAVGAIEIVPKKEFYDFEAKYTDGMAQHILPPRLPAEVLERVLADGKRAHLALGCSGYSRVDFLVTAAGDPFILEVNTLPGMTALSLLPEIAAGSGIGFADLVERILDGAALKIGAKD
jgi:D-alanine-D-alanine ligase